MISKTTRSAPIALALLVAFTSISSSASEISSSSTVTQVSMVTQVAKILGISFLAGCLIRLNTKEPDTKPVRYNIDELVTGQNVADNLWFILDDGIIGQYGSKPYAVIDPETSRLSCSTGKYPKGIMGWFSFYYKGVLTGAGMTWFIYTLAETICDSTVNTGNIVAVFAKKVEAQGKALGFPKWAELGLPLFLGGVALDETNSETKTTVPTGAKVPTVAKK